MSASRTYFLWKIFNINPRAPKKTRSNMSKRGKNSLRCGGLSTSAIKRHEKHEEERCVKCLPLSPVCFWLHCCSSQQASETKDKKTMQRCHADHRVLSLCDYFFYFTNSYHPFPSCHGWRWWWRRRRDLTHINSINSGRETRSNDMEKKWNLQTTDTRQSARSVPGVTVWKWHRLLSVASAFDGTLH